MKKQFLLTAILAATFVFSFTTQAQCPATQIAPIVQPSRSCVGMPLVLSAPAVTNASVIVDEYWLLDDVKFVSGTTVALSDNGKTLKYYVETSCDVFYSNTINLKVGQNSDTLIADLHYYDNGTPYANGGIIISLPTLGTKEYTYNLTSSTGCDSVVTISLTVEIRPNPYAHCPAILPDRLFSPNGDSNNDLWTVPNLECYDYRIEIYDRKGTLIRRCDNNFRGWDGTYSNGKLAPSTDYWYIIYLHDTGYKAFKGHFNLKR